MEGVTSTYWQKTSWVIVYTPLGWLPKNECCLETLRRYNPITPQLRWILGEFHMRQWPDKFEVKLTFLQHQVRVHLLVASWCQVTLGRCWYTFLGLWWQHLSWWQANPRCSFFSIQMGPQYFHRVYSQAFRLFQSNLAVNRKTPIRLIPIQMAPER